ncbi:uncharacterized protein BHQ10_000564 [Talaromyces amestolkiae]|uniref:Cytochrome b5 heme-binding domain-containing protein n=1 Tax=Talaromyces amestolkiae TaxID=1196081 RepID=A0A364KLY5_TALAM|nr:uncharacterized protein BHQ10_000564 [Talaromyces amestolkiae]RAO64552.1 hypothetical protein BHQ10_000564 [Talaromyces amestolkiae]
MREFTLEEVEVHKSRADLWVAIHGKVYDVTKYVKNHPGGVDVLVDVAGKDATEAYEDVGHSEDADEILEAYLIGTLKDAADYKARTTVRVVQEPVVQQPRKGSSSAVRTVGVTAGSILSLYFASISLRPHLNLHELSKPLLQMARLPTNKFGDILPHGGFINGAVAATCIFAMLGSVLVSKLSKLTEIDSGFRRFPPHIKRNTVHKIDPHLIRGFLQPKEYKTLPLVAKELLAPNVYLFVFQLPRKNEAIGLPIGQHVSIKATIDGQPVSRSYTPTSNNLDLGRLELVIKCYPDGILTGKYLANLKVGDKVAFRGPKGAMRYKKGLCKKLGMVAGGTGITPMYQLIRAICEDDTDTTEIYLIYANRSEEDILMRDKLEAFALAYPRTFKIWYMLDNPSPKWQYGKGYVTPAVMREHLPPPSPETKIMLCGPPGMVNASKMNLAGLGFQTPGPVSKMTDQIFCF